MKTEHQIYHQSSKCVIEFFSTNTFVIDKTAIYPVRIHVKPGAANISALRGVVMSFGLCLSTMQAPTHKHSTARM